MTGSVLSKGSDKGPAGITIELLKGKDEVTAEAVTDEDGKYVFFGVSPGSYNVRIGICQVSIQTVSLTVIVCFL